MREPGTEPKKKPYVSPRVLQVQRRVDGDNLAAGCKSIGASAVGGAINGNTCDNNGATCFDVGS